MDAAAAQRRVVVRRVELLHLLEGVGVDGPGAIGGALHRGVVHQAELAVARQTQIGLEEARAALEAALERVHGVLGRELGAAAAVHRQYGEAARPLHFLLKRLFFFFFHALLSLTLTTPGARSAQPAQRVIENFISYCMFNAIGSPVN